MEDSVVRAPGAGVVVDAESGVDWFDAVFLAGSFASEAGVSSWEGFVVAIVVVESAVVLLVAGVRGAGVSVALGVLVSFESVLESFVSPLVSEVFGFSPLSLGTAATPVAIAVVSAYALDAVNTAVATGVSVASLFVFSSASSWKAILASFAGVPLRKREKVSGTRFE